jgi:hypothetical protein
MTAPAHVAASDCERCRPGLVAQPVNAMSSLAFVATGIALVAGADRAVGSSADAAVGWAAVAAGLGSVAYHGPGTSAGRYVHDATLVGLLATVVVADASRITGRPAHRGVLAAVPVLALVGAVPRWSMHTQAVVGVAATVSESVRIAGLPSTTAGRWRHRVAGWWPGRAPWATSSAGPGGRGVDPTAGCSPTPCGTRRWR